MKPKRDQYLSMKPYLSLFSFLLFLSSNYAVRAQPKAIFVGLSRITEWVVSDICIQDEFNLPTMRYDIDGRNRGPDFLSRPIGVGPGWK